MMEGATENRAAREILERMGEKALFAYQQGMEITVPESDCRSSLDKIALYHRESQFALSSVCPVRPVHRICGIFIQIHDPQSGCSDNSGSGNLLAQKERSEEYQQGCPAQPDQEDVFYGNAQEIQV